MAVFLVLRAEAISRVLDWLIARGEIPPIAAAFVGVRSYGDDRCSGESLHRFVSGPLPGWLASHVGASRRAEHRAVLAISYGAKDALAIALETRAVFGRVGLLIPGRRITQVDLGAIDRRHGRPLHAAILAGRCDQANLPTAKGLRAALAAAGHAV